MSNLKEIGKALKKRRKLLNLEIDDLKDYSDVTSATISNIENAKANPSIKTLEKILAPLGMEIKICVKEK